jgi:hypothetical protein
MPDLTITRTFNAPRELVYKAWTDSSHGNEWSAPRRFTVTATSGRRPAASPSRPSRATCVQAARGASVCDRLTARSCGWAVSIARLFVPSGS